MVCAQKVVETVEILLDELLNERISHIRSAMGLEYEGDLFLLPLQLKQMIEEFNLIILWGRFEGAFIHTCKCVTGICLAALDTGESISTWGSAWAKIVRNIHMWIIFCSMIL